MSRFSEYLLEGFGKFEITENVKTIHKKDILDIVEMILKINKVIPELLPGITNVKWYDYIKDFSQRCVNVSDLLMR